MKGYFSLLDGVRFFAAFWVMNFHYLSGGEIVPQLHWFRYGNLGVQLFFIISGFVIVQSLKGKTWKQFATGRFIRLFPLFWILCTLTYILMLLLPDPKYTFYLSDYVRSMTMLGDVFNGIIGPATLIDPSYWTLTVELLFYAGIALFVHFFSYERIRYFLLGWLIVSVCAFWMQIDENFYVKLFLVRHSSYFIFGSALALLVTHAAQSVRERYFDFGLVVASALYATAISPRALPAYSPAHPLDLSVVMILNVVFFCTVPLLIYCSRFVKNDSLFEVLAVLGGLTYPLYLLHQRMGNALLREATLYSELSWFVLVICFEVLIIALSYLVFVYDKRLRRWLHASLLEFKL